MYKFHL